MHSNHLLPHKFFWNHCAYMFTVICHNQKKKKKKNDFSALQAQLIHKPRRQHTLHNRINCHDVHCVEKLSTQKIVHIKLCVNSAISIMLMLRFDRTKLFQSEKLCHQLDKCRIIFKTKTTVAYAASMKYEDIYKFTSKISSCFDTGGKIKGA